MSAVDSRMRIIQGILAFARANDGAMPTHGRAGVNTWVLLANENSTFCSCANCDGVGPAEYNGRPLVRIAMIPIIPDIEMAEGVVMLDNGASSAALEGFPSLTELVEA